MSANDSIFTRDARRALENGEPEKAIKILGSWLRLSPDDAGAWQVAGAAHFELGDWSAAEHAAREVVRLHPESARHRCNLGAVLRRAGKPAEAREALDEALRIDPDLQRARSELALLDEEPHADPPEPPVAGAQDEDGPRRTTETATVVREAEMSPPPAAPASKQPPPPPPAEEKRPPPPPPPPPDDEKPSADLHMQADRAPDGWKVRSPDGGTFGPLSDAQLREFVREGRVGQNWRARFGSGRVVSVREALGPDVCDELMRERFSDASLERQSAQGSIDRDDAGSGVAAFGGALLCPHCGEWSVASQRESRRDARIAIIILGFFLWPLWLLLLALKDRTEYLCASCGTEWSEPS